jgi:hypothetical protein
MEDLIKGKYVAFKHDFAMKCLDANKNLTLRGTHEKPSVI